MSNASDPLSGQSPAVSLWRLIPALGVAQIIGWGSLYYSIAVFAAPIATTLQLPASWVFTAFTVSLFASGLVAPFAGRIIDRRGGRGLLATSSILAAIAFALLAYANGALVLFTAWLVAGLAMGCGLYDAALATLQQLVPEKNYRRAVTALTLFGGFASTVFWPLSHHLTATIGWRAACMIYAGLHLGVCCTLYWFGIPRRLARPSAPSHGTIRSHAAIGTTRNFVWLATAFALGSFTFSVLSVHLIGIFEAGGYTAADAILVGAMIGPLQVLARIVEFVFARELRAVTVGTFAFTLMLAALISLALARNDLRLAITFAVLYGSSNGVMTIVRGTVPLELFGREGFGTLLGRLAMPSFIAKAAAPAAFSGILALGVTTHDALLVLVSCAGAALLSYQMARLTRS